MILLLPKWSYSVKLMYIIDGDKIELISKSDGLVVDKIKRLGYKL